MSSPGDVPPEYLDRVRPVCLGLPETYEQLAWIGVRWRVRQRTFGHLYLVEPELQRAYAGAMAQDEPVCVLTFRAAGEELDGLARAGFPFYRAGWGRDVMAVVLHDGTDWDEIAELLTESYCLLAPKKLVARVDRPDPP